MSGGGRRLRVPPAPHDRRRRGIVATARRAAAAAIAVSMLSSGIDSASTAAAAPAPTDQTARSTPGAALPTELASPRCVACRGVDEERDTSTFSAAEWTSLERGDVLVTGPAAAGQQDDRAGTVQAAALVHRSARQVWTVLVDYPSRAAFQPGARDVRAVRTAGHTVWVFEYARFFLVDVRYTIISTLDPERGRISWTLDKSLPHDIADTTGRWELIPRLSGSDTLVVYRAWIDTGRAIPAFIEHFLMRRSLPALLTGLRSQVDERFP